MSQAEPCQANQYLAQHIALLNSSLQYWRGRGLPHGADAQAAYHAPFALLSHGTENDPIIHYANLTAQRLFDMSWPEITQLPSRLSAESVEQHERSALLQRVTNHGYIDDYSGIRMAKSGQRFLIQRATVWNLRDADGQNQGQAAMFADWQMLSSPEQATLGT